jgi:hypothetical protein
MTRFRSLCYGTVAVQAEEVAGVGDVNLDFVPASQILGAK